RDTARGKRKFLRRQPPRKVSVTKHEIDVLTRVSPISSSETDKCLYKNVIAFFVDAAPDQNQAASARGIHHAVLSVWGFPPIPNIRNKKSFQDVVRIALIRLTIQPNYTDTVEFEY